MGWYPAAHWSLRGESPRQIRDLSIPQEGLWSYIDIYDLAEAIVLASECAAPGHEVVLGLGCIVAFALPLILFIPNSLTY